MLLTCPHCGKESDLSPLPGSPSSYRCGNPACGAVFSVETDASGGEPSVKAEPPQAQDKLSHEEVAKSLAQDYFADLPEVALPEETAVKQADAPAPTAEEAQLQQLYRLAEQKKKEKLEEKAVWTERITKPKQQRFIREKKSQVVLYWVLLALLFALPILRIVFTRLWASLEQMSKMQLQMIPSILYFLAALLLLYHLIRKTTRPHRVAAFLLLIPLLLDGWYLLPGALDILPADLWLTIGNSAKILISLFGLAMSVSANRHPARTYKEVEIDHGRNQ